MKSILYFIILYFTLMALMLAGLPGCGDTTSAGCKEGSGEIISKSKQNDNFHSIDLKANGNVVISQGTQFYVQLETDDNLMNNVVFSVSSNTLSIDSDRDICPTKLEVNITAPDFKSLSISGSGNITKETGLQLQDLELSISGSGNINLDSLAAGNLSSTISGSGDIRPKGLGNSADILISGSGNFSGTDFQVKVATATISGSGNIEVNASDTLTVNITGSGSVFYKGNPILNTTITGSGKVIPQP